MKSFASEVIFETKIRKKRGNFLSNFCGFFVAFSDTLTGEGAIESLLCGEKSKSCVI